MERAVLGICEGRVNQNTEPESRTPHPPAIGSAMNDECIDQLSAVLLEDGRILGVGVDLAEHLITHRDDYEGVRTGDRAGSVARDGSVGVRTRFMAGAICRPIEPSVRAQE